MDSLFFCDEIRRMVFIPCRSADIFPKAVDIFEKAPIYW